MAGKNPHFYVPNSFGALPHELTDFDNSKVVLLPVPYDSTTTYMPGTRNGPRAIVEASRFLELYDEESGKNFSGLGICTLDELEVVDSAEKTVGRVYESVKLLLEKGKKVAVLGGEHSISSGAVKAHKEEYPGLSVLHVDAHADMRDELGGNRHNHGCVARRISEMCPLVSVGVRSLGEEEAEHISNSSRIKLFFAKDVCGVRDNGWMDDVADSLGKDVYVTVDLDALDPAIMPSVGTPQPGGLGWHETLELMRTLSGRKNVVGFDVTELMPLPGIHAPNFLAAKLVYKLIGYFFAES